MLAGVPLAFTLGPDPGAVDQKVQRSAPTTVGGGHIQFPLTTAERAVVRHWPVQPYQAQETFDEPSRLSQRHAEQYLHRQAHLDRGIAEARLSATLPGPRRPQHHVRIEPNRQRPASLQRLIVRRSVRDLALRRRPAAHSSAL